jgi:hypothetical protein
LITFASRRARFVSRSQAVGTPKIHRSLGRDTPLRKFFVKFLDPNLPFLVYN